MSETCKICNKDFLMTRDLSNHIRILHKQTNQEYWLQFIKPSDFQEKCTICNIEKKKFLYITQHIVIKNTKRAK